MNAKHGLLNKVRPSNKCLELFSDVENLGQIGFNRQSSKRDKSGQKSVAYRHCSGYHCIWRAFAKCRVQVASFLRLNSMIPFKCVPLTH